MQLIGIQSMNHNFKDISGKDFGRLIVVSLSHVNRGLVYWSCICTCGTKKTISGFALRSGNTKSCGCLSAESAARRMTKHGRYGTPEYISWMAMITRCTNPNQPHWKNYGGR